MVNVEVGLRFEKPGYIGLPYWPERNQIINITKEVNPKLGEAKKQAALLAALEKRGLTMADYEVVVHKAARPFYTNGSEEIVIPERVFQSFINHASMTAPKAIPRIMSKGLTFIGVRIVDGYLHTGKTAPDGTFDRFVKLEESNQRSFSSSPYIADFTAEGRLQVDEEIIKAADLRKLVEWAGRWNGIGSARPQGYGRFSVMWWDSEKSKAKPESKS